MWEPKRILSYSTISKWMICPLQAKYSKIDLLPEKQNAAASFGTVIHDVLERHAWHMDVEQAVEEFKDLWLHPEKLDVTPEVWPKFKSFASYMQRGEEFIRAHHERLIWETNRTLIATEHEFVVPIGDYALHGFVDVLEQNLSNRGVPILKISDMKTTATAWTPSLTELRYNLQGTIYDYASRQREFWLGTGDVPGLPNGEELFEKYKQMRRRFIWISLVQAKELDAGERTQADFDRLYRIITEIDRAIEAEVYVPNISASSCGICSFTKECGITIPDDSRFDDDAWCG